MRRNACIKNVALLRKKLSYGITNGFIRFETEFKRRIWKMVGAIIQARMNSTRLPGKVLLNINGRPMLSYMIERVRWAQCIDQIVVATSDEPQDDVLCDFCTKENIGFYRGSLNDVLARYYKAAKQINSDIIVRLTADCPLIDPKIIDTMVQIYQSGSYDYVANTAPPDGRTFPDGMDVEVFSLKALEDAWKEAKKPSEREHVTFYFWKNPKIFSTLRYDLVADLSTYRLSVDYPEDFAVIVSLFKGLYPQNPMFTMEDIIAFMETNPDITKKNAHIEPNRGWQPALEKDKKEGF
jgi:spore coat polysaccharide biosynthesis protein SpsF